MDPKLLRSLVVTLIPSLLVGLLGGYLLDAFFTKNRRKRLPSRSSMDEFEDDDDYEVIYEDEEPEIDRKSVV